MKGLNVLVTAAGSIGAINYVRALRKELSVRVVGTDFYPLNAEMNSLDVYCKSPKHHQPDFPGLIDKLALKADFVHPSIEAESRVVSCLCSSETVDKTFLPSINTSGLCSNKAEVCNLLAEKDLAKPALHYPQVKDCLESVFNRFGVPVWVRQRSGAGGRGSLACYTPEMLRDWVKLYVMAGKGKEHNFIVQPYLNGRDYSFVSLWFHGKLLTSYCKERVSYVFPHLTLSGITGTPAVSKILHNQEVNEAGTNAILTLDKEPHGIFCVDLKEHNNKVYVTEVNCKAQTTMFLWSYVASCMGLKERNLAVYYTVTGVNREPPYMLAPYNLYPEGWVLLRHIDAGVKLIAGAEKLTIPLMEAS